MGRSSSVSAFTKKEINLIALLTFGAAAVLATGPIVANLIGSRKSQAWHKLDLCQRNLECIAYAIGQYSTDNHARLPANIWQLAPRYLPKLPKCPAAGIDTYSIGYVQSGQNYTIFCSGDNHVGDLHRSLLGPNYPQFGSANLASGKTRGRLR